MYKSIHNYDQVYYDQFYLLVTTLCTVGYGNQTYQNIFKFVIIIKDLFNLLTILHHMPHEIAPLAALVCMLRYGTYFPRANQKRILTLKQIAVAISKSHMHVQHLL